MDFISPYTVPSAVVKFADEYYPKERIPRLATHFNKNKEPLIAIRKIKKLRRINDKIVYLVEYHYPDGFEMGTPYMIVQNKNDIHSATNEELDMIYRKTKIIDHTPSYIPDAVIKKLDIDFPLINSSGDLRIIKYLGVWNNKEVYSFRRCYHETKLTGPPSPILYDCENAKFTTLKERQILMRKFPNMRPKYKSKEVPTFCKSQLKHKINNN